MTQQEHFEYWLEIATRDWQATQALSVKSGRSALVFAHWTLEKLSKALWVQQHGQTPPATDPVSAVLAVTSFALTPTQLLFTLHLEAAHDDVLEPNPEQPLHLEESPQELLIQANALREQLLDALHLAAC